MKKIVFLTLWTILSLFAKPSVAQPKLQMLFVYQDGCFWCEKMERELFDKPSNMAKISRRYRFAKMNKNDPKLPVFLDPHFFPTTYILSPDGKRIVDELPGYMKTDQFLDYIKELYELEGHTSR